MTEQIIEILKEITECADDLNWDTASLLEEELLDSVKMVELVENLETAFGISISPMDLEAENFESVAAIEHLIKKNKNGLEGAQG